MLSVSVFLGPCSCRRDAVRYLVWLISQLLFAIMILSDYIVCKLLGVRIAKSQEVA
jgi:hypothetical protein